MKTILDLGLTFKIKTFARSEFCQDDKKRTKTIGEK